MITIRHISGPLAGQTLQIDGEKGRITFGRDAEVCDVVYPPDATIVARRHFALEKKPSGDWTFDLFGHPYVAVNGMTAEVGEPAHSGAKIELGQKGGPSFEIVIDEKPAANRLLETQPQQKMVGSHAAAQHAERSASFARRFAAAGLLLALIAGGAAGYVYYERARNEKRFSEQLQALAETQQRVAAQTISREARQKLEQASWVVLLTDAAGGQTATGTAFAIGPHLFGTNAHVAKIRETLKPGQKLAVRAPGANGRVLEVVDHKIHPGYKALEDYLESDPFLVQTFKRSGDGVAWDMLGSSNTGGYDVATLTVDGPPVENVLEIAPQAELEKLSPGDPLAYAGYPVESILGSEVQQIAPTPNQAAGAVLALTDMFSLPAEPSKRRFVHHNLGIAGGASGSAMIGASGRVVALVNAGNMLTDRNGNRIPSGALINYAQRADFLSDLVSGKADATLGEERAYWEKQTANFKRGADVLIPDLLAAEAPKKDAKWTVVEQKKIDLSEGQPVVFRNASGAEVPSRRVNVTPMVKAGQRQTLLVYAAGGTPVKMYLLVDGKITAKREGSSWYGALSFDGAADHTYELVVTGPDKNRSFTLTNYVWDGVAS